MTTTSTSSFVASLGGLFKEALLHVATTNPAVYWRSDYMRTQSVAFEKMLGKDLLFKVTMHEDGSIIRYRKLPEAALNALRNATTNKEQFAEVLKKIAFGWTKGEWEISLPAPHHQLTSYKYFETINLKTCLGFLKFDFATREHVFTTKAGRPHEALWDRVVSEEEFAQLDVAKVKTKLTEMIEKCNAVFAKGNVDCSQTECIQSFYPIVDVFKEGEHPAHPADHRVIYIDSACRTICVSVRDIDSKKAESKEETRSTNTLASSSSSNK